MSTTQEASGMAISEQVEEMDRGELESFAVNLYEDLEDRIASLEQKDEEQDERISGLEDWQDDHEIRHEAMSNWQDNLEDRMEAIERGEVSLSDVVDAAATDSELQIQRWRADVKEAGHPDDVSGLSKNQARSTELWAHFYDLADPTHGKLKLPRRAATKIYRNISDYDLPTDRNTVNRGMRFMARGTGSTDDPTNDDHLITFVPGDEGSQSVLVADQDEYEEFVADAAGIDTPDRERDVDLYAVPDASSGGVDAGEADDATDNVVEDSAVITDAEPVTSAAGDPVMDDNGIEDDSPSAREL